MIYVYIVLTVLLIESSYLVMVNQKKISTKIVQRNIYIDTSVLIDGRIVSVAETGFLGGVFQIPKSVVAELQLMADGNDPEKRSRARHGLDIIAELQALQGVDVNILQDKNNGIGVDDQLINLAKEDPGSAICTLDYNLNKVATVEGVNVLNINELALALRLRYLPGEKLEVQLTQKGQESMQAVGNTPDGTMVVVDKAAKKIGQTVKIEVVRSLQTQAGKMVFGKLIEQQVKSGSAKQKPQSSDKATAISKKSVIKKPIKAPRKPKTQEDRLLDLVNNQ